MNKIRNNTVAQVIANPFGKPLQVLQLDEGYKSSPFVGANRATNSAVNHLYTAALVRPLTPFYTAAGGYERGGVAGAVGGAGVGLLVGGLAVAGDLVKGLASTLSIPSHVAMCGAQHLKDQRADAASAGMSGAEALHRPLTKLEVIAGLAAEPCKPIEVYSQVYRRDQTGFDDARNDLAVVANSCLTLPALLSVPFVSAYGAFDAARRGSYGMLLAPLAGAAGFVGGAINAVVLGATSNVVRAGAGLIAAGMSTTQGLIESMKNYDTTST